ncbi:hypothetical protein KHA93_14855 [Bacillus sp. FJAT-49732]|uniref:Uncharacterized protein n=1 Tax=Lederbergia citrisecunda TaxID=2833583 RepID=A0A942YLZ2_9BACI|nr:hypothetical protein [Lederbergia citrisecunda]MBS4200914.1 hypothetical protein [Lederbergia citrisecunda]
MNKKQKIIFRSSIFVNIILALLIVWVLVNNNFANEQLFFTEVQENLVELEGLIAHQIDNKWSEPNLVTTKLGDVLNGLNLGLSNGMYLNSISNKDREFLERFSSKLRQYPHDELYALSKLSKEDKEYFEALRTNLREVGLGLNITIMKDWKSFISILKALEERIEVPLNK